MAKKMKALGKIIITKINEKKINDLKNKKIHLPDDLQKQMLEDDVIKDSEFYCTLEVVGVGPEVREEIKVGKKIIVPAGKLNYLDRIIFEGKAYHTIIDSESMVPVVLD